MKVKSIIYLRVTKHMQIDFILLKLMLAAPNVEPNLH